MKIFPRCLLFMLCCLPAFAETNFFAEAGVSYITLRRARYEPGAGTFAVESEDKSRTSPFVGIGYAFSDRFGLRLSYQNVGSLDATTLSTLPFPSVPGVTAGSLPQGNFQNQIHDNVRMLALAPEFKWSPIARLTMTLSPELNWADDRGQTTSIALGDYHPPATRPRPVTVDRSASNLTLGGSIGAAWSLNEKCSFSLSYRYADLQPSWNRQAQILSAALRWHF